MDELLYEFEAEDGDERDRISDPGFVGEDQLIELLEEGADGNEGSEESEDVESMESDFVSLFKRSMAISRASLALSTTDFKDEVARARRFSHMVRRICSFFLPTIIPI